MSENTTHRKKIKNVQEQESKKIGNKEQSCFSVRFCFRECYIQHIHCTFPSILFSQSTKTIERTKKIPITHMDSIPQITLSS